MRFPPRFRPLALPLLAALAFASPPTVAEMIGGNPGPAHNYVCPNADGKPALDCYFDAVAHLYTMCKHVKSIEIIEFGYEKSTEGTNGAKSELCLTKQKINMTRPYQSALKDAKVSQQAVEGMRSLNEYWLKVMSELGWKTGETDAEYKERTQAPYANFAERIAGIKTVVEIVKTRTTPAPAAPAAAKKAKN